MTTIRQLSPARRSTYLKMLSRFGNHILAAETCGVDPDSIKRLIKKDPAFAAQCEQARADAYERLEGEAYRRAVVGIEEPVYYEGVRVDTITKYSDGLLGKLLEANNPKFARKVAVVGDGGGPVKVEHDLRALSDADLTNLEAILARAGSGQG